MSEINQNNNQEEINMEELEEVKDGLNTTEKDSKTNDISDGVVVQEEVEKAENTNLDRLEGNLEVKVEPVKKKPGPKPKNLQQIVEEKVKPKIEESTTEQPEKLKVEEPVIEEVIPEEKLDEVIIVKQRITNKIKHQTAHNFEPDDVVYVAEFKNVRETMGYTRLENQFKFVPVSGEIEKIFITKESGVKCVRYKLKNKAGSMFDEEDVCSTIDECIELCDLKNRRG